MAAWRLRDRCLMETLGPIILAVLVVAAVIQTVVGIVNPRAGLDPDDCTACRGRGWLPDPRPSNHDRFPCRYCRGTGKER